MYKHSNVFSRINISFPHKSPKKYPRGSPFGQLICSHLLFSHILVRIFVFVFIVNLFSFINCTIYRRDDFCSMAFIRTASCILNHPHLYRKKFICKNHLPRLMALSLYTVSKSIQLCVKQFVHLCPQGHYLLVVGREYPVAKILLTKWWASPISNITLILSPIYWTCLYREHLLLLDRQMPAVGGPEHIVQTVVS